MVSIFMMNISYFTLLILSTCSRTTASVVVSEAKTEFRP